MEKDLSKAGAECSDLLCSAPKSHCLGKGETSGDQDHAGRTEGKQMLGAAQSLLCDFFSLPPQVQSSCGERRQTSRPAAQPSYFHMDLKNKTKHKAVTSKHSRSLWHPRVSCPRMLLSSCPRKIPPHRCSCLGSGFFCVSPTRPSNSPFPEDKQLPLDLCRQLPECSADSQTAPPAQPNLDPTHTF